MTYVTPLRLAILSALLFLGASGVWAQQPPTVMPPTQRDGLTTAIHELQEQVRELRAAVDEMRSEASRYRAETVALRRDLQANRASSHPTRI